jgi:hypothetical protein
MILINYIAIGALIMFIMEVVIDPHKEEIALIEQEDEPFQFDWITRTFCIIAWPIALAIILKHAITWIKNILK